MCRYNDSEGQAQFLEDTLTPLEDCGKKHGWERCAVMFEWIDYTLEQVFFHADQLLRGLHWVWLSGWLSYFGEDLLVVFSEDYFENPRKVGERVAAHLGLETPLSDEIWEKMKGQEQHAPSVGWKKGLTDVTEKRLKAFYGQHNKKLGELLFGEAVDPWEVKAWDVKRWKMGGGHAGATAAGAAAGGGTGRARDRRLGVPLTKAGQPGEGIAAK